MLRALAATAGVAVAFTAFMGFAHTKPGRPILAWMGLHKAASGACPFGYSAARTPEQKEAARRSFAASHGAEDRASTRPALGFELDRTTRAELLAWAAANGVSCKALRSSRGSRPGLRVAEPPAAADPELDCSGVPSQALPEAYQGADIASLWLGFGARDELVSLVTVRRDASARAISSTFQSMTSQVTRTAGPPRSIDGDASPATLASGLLRQASAEYRFRDYYVVARATNMGDGFALTEEYRSLPD